MNTNARLLAVVLLLGAAPVASGQTPHVSGTVTYRERMALSPTAVVEIRLDDVTSPGGVPPIVALTRVNGPGQVPIRFELQYDARAIDARGRYAVRATISDGGVVLFTSLDTPLVLTQGHGSRADLVLTRVAGALPPAPPPIKQPAPPLPANPLPNLPATFTGTVPCADCEGMQYQLNLFPDDSFFLRMTHTNKPDPATDDIGSWALSSDLRILVLKGRQDRVSLFSVSSSGKLAQLGPDGQTIAGTQPNELTRASVFKPVAARLPMRGVYTMTDSAMFVECSTGQRWPVAAQGAARDLESAYARTRSAPGAAVVAEVEGVATPRVKADGSSDTALIVEKVGRLLPKESCAPRFASAPLAESYWRLTHLKDRAVPAASDPKREPSLTFQKIVGSSPGTFSGASGCNRVVGHYEIDAATMTLTSGGTLMACREEAAIEAAFVAMLKATRTYRISGRVLELFDEGGARLARFEARIPAGITVR